MLDEIACKEQSCLYSVILYISDCGISVQAFLKSHAEAKPARIRVSLSLRKQYPVLHIRQCLMHEPPVGLTLLYKARQLL